MNKEIEDKISFADWIITKSLRFNGHHRQLKHCKDVTEFKRSFLKIYYPKGKPDEGFVKTARTLNFKAIFEFIKTL